MCGRFARFSPAHIFRMLFQLDEFLDLVPQYNIAPGQDVFAVRGIVIRDVQQRSASSPRNFSKEVSAFRWGLIPFWAKDPQIGTKTINARSETVAEKPTFREAFKKHRCLIPVDGFYEWQKQKEGKKPYFIHMTDKQPFALGGIWDTWTSPQGKVLESCSILTTAPNEVVKPIHKRMPLIIEPKDFDLWLDPTILEPDKVKSLLKPYTASAMTAYPLSTFVNSPRNQGEQCIAELVEKTKQTKLF